MVSYLSTTEYISKGNTCFVFDAIQFITSLLQKNQKKP